MGTACNGSRGLDGVSQLVSERIIAPSIAWLGMPREYLNPGEMEILCALANSIHARDMLEFGCHDGRTAAVMLHNVPSLERYQGIDVVASYQPKLAHQKSEIPLVPGLYVRDDPRCEVIVRERGSLDLEARDLHSCDFAFVDGDHSEEVVLHDSFLAYELVRPCGLIVWHDFNNGGVEVTQALHELIANNGWPIVSIDRTWLAFMRCDDYRL